MVWNVLWAVAFWGSGTLSVGGGGRGEVVSLGVWRWDGEGVVGEGGGMGKWMGRYAQLFL